jgi:hypothetical protein
VSYGPPRTFLGQRVDDLPVSGPQVAKNVVGSAAERLVARALGARPWDPSMPPFEVPADVATETDGSPYGLVPDAWWARHSGLLEVKAGIARFYTTERQWRSYLWARDTQGSGLPIERPRVFYGFFAYSLSQRTDKYPGAHAVLDDALSRLRYILVFDSQLVARVIAGSSTTEDWEGPLSPMLGAWHAHYNIRAHRLQGWAEAPRARLDELGLSRWRAPSIKATFRAACDELVREGWARVPDVPAYVIAPCRRPRIGPAVFPGAQATLFAGGVQCLTCGFYAPVGICPECGDVNAF